MNYGGNSHSCGLSYRLSSRTPRRATPQLLLERRVDRAVDLVPHLELEVDAS